MCELSLNASVGCEGSSSSHEKRKQAGLLRRQDATRAKWYGWCRISILSNHRSLLPKAGSSSLPVCFFYTGPRSSHRLAFASVTRAHAVE